MVHQNLTEWAFSSTVSLAGIGIPYLEVKVTGARSIILRSTLFSLKIKKSTFEAHLRTFKGVKTAKNYGNSTNNVARILHAFSKGNGT